ncbi:conjugal transfer protein MobC [Flavobacterium johnsoniae]|uniref:Bacteroides conjugative transposon MobC/BfmC-like protein n=1 Tax=Flavobacterium johnsoniae (strain ATCC 17061 / DSM 2064 / JCM 8514 / BCRC 14874 / CCUG 350202 / NBRC 14942 / NCIMB 11054 / UW101) TaxID=376686 RepID=A5FBN6_FLAJ1|nr:conjugal transfer protein MobC [Flavobacterium johnsoniae]ABQ07388.1 Bacteroides conjugative transposon MobC/BfmC-like protein [Flavobacterium johnsoniae UW101]OXE99301.1 conjugal transfer protein TraG [Flavobacterium johnsoniae UW101]WQG80776.1 conjugal transfer protein MobC [Flavobacterium johnsoniae UW101]SHL14461.1 Type IV secretory system Conjugative DNA transfer [Flavobacterium johnsoniae]
MQTGENEQALRKILDMTRLMGIAVLLIHFYYYCFDSFMHWNLAPDFACRILENIYRTGLLDSFHKSKLFALGLLVISLMGARGRKDEKLHFRTAFNYISLGLLLYFGSYPAILIFLDPEVCSVLYISLCSLGYLMTLSGGTLLSRIIRRKLGSADIFNKENETFPQEERLIENEYSVNLPARYHLKDKVRSSWINIINPFRGILVPGTPGSGKSYFVIRHIITQHIAKGFSMFIYDFKFDDLTVIAYNAWLKFRHLYAVEPKFYIINFDDLSRTHRCNPLDPAAMTDITDAAESARTILMGLNREWIKKQGDFFVESPINFLTAVIWYLRKYNDGEFCTLPHVIEMIQTDYESLFTILRTEKEIEVLINPFVSAFLNEAVDQLEGQIASAKISLAKLSSPQLYYVLSGSDFTLDINNPSDPKIVSMGNNPQKIQTYGAVLSLFVSRLIKQVNQKGKLKSSLIFDEFPTIYLNNIDSLIATARSNKVSTCLGIQDFSQLRKDYGREQADVIINIVGNIVCGQVSGDTAKQLSERFGKIMQDRESLSINSSDTSISRSRQLESAVPPSKISSLSSGEFVGMTADNPDCRIELKTFHCEIINDHEKIKKETDNYKEIPIIRTIDNVIIQKNYLQIKIEIQEIIHSEMERIIKSPQLSSLVLKKEK